ncbi:hypothetical protein A2819_00120 [Candidatus Azambacteria bacterium RIFCSPHIGHO2_01_FULL_40_24]|uniref:Uncharacterized protein n=1 Tax=Candidatus Azambacteria bacterium RIFCSPHIGHO2_01_FULL_40_24 TaxID=1797301 RepID=A0A1F5B3A0_9BACT|nr:MAG: hypothetical protein A2819_00120 [Candidatus Azambacteria bacterium RIFCSPHIGHO2_01_FULL_40_24]OGN22631.1 MAG: hypothetical protein A2915_01165 [Candidatus Yanofskybacteria bacterium RIFCSPLOWO2_01_FULL_41_34]
MLIGSGVCERAKVFLILISKPFHSPDMELVWNIRLIKPCVYLFPELLFLNTLFGAFRIPTSRAVIINIVVDVAVLLVLGLFFGGNSRATFGAGHHARKGEGVRLGSWSTLAT